MSREPGITTTGRITGALKNDCYQAELPNGKVIHAFPGKSLRRNPALTFSVGDPVPLRLSPYDLSKAEILDSENL